MTYTEQGTGPTALFLIPVAKLAQRQPEGLTVEERVHEFLLTRYGGYTTPTSTLRGYWIAPSGERIYGEHREYRVLLDGERSTAELKGFLAKIASEIAEQCICFSAGDRSCFIYPTLTATESYRP